ncbi:hypothetical protein GCM10011579_067240 [Streptomyces albiflavescens]|uniref:Uncharacterized protein n=1 Tax=Streptomyces albiflavescens TaxID=1623582 RepID=A0A917YC68_9ACTN|nr:hypothetical protein GCM10011579_067240 [Streptomyces albiflavescens]
MGPVLKPDDYLDMLVGFVPAVELPEGAKPLWATGWTASGSDRRHAARSRTATTTTLP